MRSVKVWSAPGPITQSCFKHPWKFPTACNCWIPAARSSVLSHATPLQDGCTAEVAHRLILCWLEGVFVLSVRLWRVMCLSMTEGPPALYTPAEWNSFTAKDKTRTTPQSCNMLCSGSLSTGCPLQTRKDSATACTHSAMRTSREACFLGEQKSK